MVIRVDQDDGDYFEHTCHSYPEYSEKREEHEYRCIDLGHTLANMRSQISRYGYDFCSKAAFVFLKGITKSFQSPYWKTGWIDRVSKLLSASFPVTLKIEQEW